MGKNGAGEFFVGAGMSFAEPTPERTPKKVAGSSSPKDESHPRVGRVANAHKRASATSVGVPGLLSAALGNGMNSRSAARALQFYLESRSETIAGPPELYDSLLNCA